MAITTHPGDRRLAPLPVAALMAIGLLGASTVSANAADGSPGITKPTVFAPFNPNAPACTPPGCGQGAGVRAGQ